MRHLALPLLLLAGLAAPAAAQEDDVDCSDPRDQSSMTRCAGLDFERADRELNAIWPEIRQEAQESDESTGNGGHDYRDALMASQRAWLAYRDAECTWQGFAAHGGSMEPMLVNACLARLTEERIKALKEGQEE